jgi:hypothetical protein
LKKVKIRTKTEILITDLEGNKIKELFLKKGCNPNFNGIENSLNVLKGCKSIFDQIEMEQQKIETVNSWPNLNNQQAKNNNLAGLPLI